MDWAKTVPTSLAPSVAGNFSTHNATDPRRCYVEHRVEDCLRVSLLLLLTVGTAVACVIRTVQYHYYRSKRYECFLLYYIANLILLLSLIHWSYVHQHAVVIDIINTYLVVVQLLIICYSLCFWAFRVSNRETAFYWIVIPFLVLNWVYFTGVFIWALSTVPMEMKECTKPQWLLFTVSQLLLVQFFLLAVLYISRSLDNVQTAHRTIQKAQLWSLTVVYEILAVSTFVYDLALVIIRTKSDDCSSTFTSNSYGALVIYVIHKVMKYLLPQWTICLIFYPHRTQPVEGGEEDHPSSAWMTSSSSQQYKSVFYGGIPSESQRLLPSVNSPPQVPPVGGSVVGGGSVGGSGAGYRYLPQNTPYSPASYLGPPTVPPWLRTTHHQAGGTEGGLYGTTAAPPPPPPSSSSSSAFSSSNNNNTSTVSGRATAAMAAAPASSSALPGIGEERETVGPSARHNPYNPWLGAQPAAATNTTNTNAVGNNHPTTMVATSSSTTAVATVAMETTAVYNQPNNKSNNNNNNSNHSNVSTAVDRRSRERGGNNMMRASPSTVANGYGQR